jgi:hypothetical protein
MADKKVSGLLDLVRSGFFGGMWTMKRRKNGLQGSEMFSVHGLYAIKNDSNRKLFNNVAHPTAIPDSVVGIDKK